MKILSAFLVSIALSQPVLAERSSSEQVPPATGHAGAVRAEVVGQVAGRQAAGKSQAADLAEAIALVTDKFDKLTEKGIRMNFGGDVRALKVLKQHLERADKGEKLPPSLLNWFQDIEARGFEAPSNSDLRGIFDVIRMLVTYQNHLLSLYDEEVGEREKAELDVIAEYVKMFDAKAKADGTIQLEWDAVKQKEILAGVRTIKELRKTMKPQDSKTPNTFSAELYQIRDMLAGIDDKDRAEGFQKLGGQETIKRSNAASEALFAIYGEINKAQNAVLREQQEDDAKP